METGINNYKGLNTDISYDTIKEFYIDALDVRITTAKGESLGSITNIKGNKLYFTLPTEPSTVGIPEIIGSTSIRNRIIILVADDSGTNGWIYTVEYSDIGQEFTSLTLKYYSPELNFSKNHPIEAQGRYESPLTQRLYWTDYQESLRGVNIEDPQLLTTPVGLIDIFPNIKYNLPKLINVLGGGALATGIYQYSYRLITFDGKVSLISPPGPLIHCVSDSEGLSQSAQYSGDPEGTITNKAHEIVIDTSIYSDYESIELIVLFKESQNTTSQPFSVETKDINNNSEISFIHTGNEDSLFPIDLFEFAVKQYPFKTVKTLVAKDNALVVANIKEGQFSIQDLLESFGETFEAKTKRFDRTGQDDSSLNDPNPDIDLLNKAFNINYNKDAHWDIDWHKDNQFKYHNDGETLGGEGPNISYKFHLEPHIIDGDPQASFVNNSNIPLNNPNLNDGHGTYVNNTYDSMASPFKSGVIRGYKRGQTERFAIVFFNKKGEASFAEFIGDIKFPDISETDSSINSSGTDYFPVARETARNLPDSITTTGYALGVEFSIDFSTCPQLYNFIESFQIVRVKKETKDLRRICSGIFRVAALPDFIGEPEFDYDLRGPGNEERNVLHLFNTERYVAGSGGTPIEGYGINGNFENINRRFTSPSKLMIQGNYAIFHSPEISYRFGDSINNVVNEESMLLITGRYGQYYATLPDSSPFYNPLFQFTDNPYNDIHSFDVVADIDTSPDADLGRILDTRRKLRSVGKVEKENAYSSSVASYEPYEKGIEYIRKWKNKNDLRFSLNTTNEADLLEERGFLLGPYQGTNDIGNNWNPYFRNFYYNIRLVYSSGGNVLLGSELNYPLIENSPQFSKGASGIIGNFEKITNDPLSPSVVLPKTASRDYFPSGVSWESAGQIIVGASPSNIAPLNNSVTVENSTSTPLIDIVVPKKEIFGGYSEDALKNNVFIPASPVISKENTNPKVFGGDIFIGMFELQINSACLDPKIYETTSSKGYTGQMIETIAFPVETRVNLDLAYGCTPRRGVTYEVPDADPNLPLVEREIFRQETNNKTTLYGKSESMYDDTYNEAYSLKSDDVKYFINPFIGQPAQPVTNDIRAYISNIKFNNEQIDSWSQFGLNNFYDVDDYGPINKILNFNDEVFFIQDKGVGRYAINPRVAISTADAIPIELGSGEGFQDHKYISNKTGSIHQWGIKESQSGIYFWDDIHKKIVKVGENIEPISESKGISSLVRAYQGEINLRKESTGDNPIRNKGVHIGKDDINNELLFTFWGTVTVRKLIPNTFYEEGDILQITNDYFKVVEDFQTEDGDWVGPEVIDLYSQYLISITDIPKNSHTLVYDEIVQQFSSRFSATPPIYIENSNVFLSPDNENRQNIYRHNVGNWGEFYGKKVEMSVTLVLNEHSHLNKILRTVEFNSKVRNEDKTVIREETITAFSITTEYQSTGKINFSADRIKRKFDKWRIKIPRDTESNGRNRLRSTYFILTLYFDNLDNKELILNKIMSHYDVQIF